MATSTDPAHMPDGTPHRLTFDEFVRLGELGIYPHRSELVDGIVYDLSPKGDAHYRAQTEILRQLIARDPEGERYTAGPEPTLKVDERNGPMPDVLVTPAGEQIFGATAGLVIEIADSSLAYDRGRKRERYAKANVGEYWVVDLRNERVERFLPSGATTASIVRAGDALAPDRFPDAAIDVARSSPLHVRVKSTSRSNLQEIGLPGSVTTYREKISVSTLSVVATTFGLARPSRFTSRSLSIVRIWSRRTRPRLFENAIETRKGEGRLPVVIGAMMTVRR